jgi:EGF domain-containing protein
MDERLMIGDSIAGRQSTHRPGCAKIVPMNGSRIERWVSCSTAVAVVLVVLGVAGVWQSSAQQAASPAGSPCAVNNGGCAAGVVCKDGPKPGTWQCGDSCPPGFTGSPETGCVDVNECLVNNGGCHKLSACRNTPGSRTCSSCPQDFAGDGYVGCFDVNECPAGDCSDRIPRGAETATPPTVTTSGDVTVAATSEAGAPATFTVSATDKIDGARQAQCLPRSGSTFPIGKTTVSCWAINSVGKIGRATLSVTVNKPQF